MKIFSRDNLILISDSSSIFSQHGHSTAPLSSLPTLILWVWFEDHLKSLFDTKHSLTAWISLSFTKEFFSILKKSLKSPHCIWPTLLPGPTLWKIILWGTHPLICSPHVLFEHVKNRINLKVERTFPEGQYPTKRHWSMASDAGACQGQSQLTPREPCGE